MALLFGLVITVISLYGYIQFLSKKIRPEFALAATFASIGSIMFFTGILNIMPLATYITAAFGIVLAASSLKDIKNSVARIITPGTVFFGVISAVLAVVIKGSYFTGGDAYHHWGIVSRLLIQYNRLPTPENFNITFPSYPTGSASFIYYFGKLCHADSAWFIILIQTILTLAMFVAVFAFAKGKLANIITCVVVIMLLCTNEPFQYIVVDNLLASITVAGMSIAIYYKDSLQDKLIYILPFTVFLTAVKNSGVLFAFIIAFYCFIYIPKTKPTLIKSAGLLLSPFATLVLWQKHVDLLFPTNRSEAHHAMSVDHYKTMYKEKVELNIVGQTWDMYSEHVFTLNNVVLFVFSLILLCLIYSYITDKKLNKDFLQISAFSAFIYIVYQIGLLGTYVFSMPAYEMNNPSFLPSYDRYHLTIIAVIAALVYIGILSYLKKETSGNCSFKSVYSALLVSTIAFTFLSCNPHFNYFKPQTELNDDGFLGFVNFAEEYAIPHRSSYLIIDHETGSFLQYYARYLLDPTDVKSWSVETLQKYERYINNYEYLLLIDNSPETMAYISQLLGADITEKVVHIPSYIDQVYVYD